MNSDGASITNHKQRGEWAELRFMARASEKGFRVTKPWGDSARYDFALETGDRFLRVQVKSTIARGWGGFICSLNPTGGPRYTVEQVDFFAVFVIPCDIWYILPAAVALQTKGRFFLAPDHQGQKYEAYKEAWHLMRASHNQGAQPSPGPSNPDSASPDNQQSIPTGDPTENREPTTENCLTGQTDDRQRSTVATSEPETVPEMRGAVEPAPKVGFDRDLLRRRMAACFDFVGGRRK